MTETELNSSNFNDFVSSTNLPVLIDFYAPGCGPCQQIKPVISGIAAKYNNIVRVGLVNVDLHPALAKRYNIRSIPALVIFKNGVPFSESIGIKNEKQIMNLINEGKKDYENKP